MDFKIVEYDHSYAAQLADMWNRSGDSWGGYNMVISADQIRREMEAAVHVGAFLAVMDTEVVGFCQIGEWTQGEGALYVEVLNVRPDLHGRKIGKALVLKSVERTAELGWPRLDLHTWEGNTKAVPLYKKTGFFWEERDSEVYMVNFIPSVLENELTRDFFKNADWYQDSTREIAVEPDGQNENDFTYFTYSWQKGPQVLEMEYERRGRGLRRIKTNDFEISLTVDNPKLVFGKSYEARFSIRNCGRTPLDVEITGISDKNIESDFHYTGTVADSDLVTGGFRVGPVTSDQDDWKTHPRVLASVIVNGKPTQLMVGIVPKFPVGLILRRRPGVVQAGQRERLYLDVENNLNENVEVVLSLPESKDIVIETPSLFCPLRARQRASVPVDYTARNSCVYAGPVQAEVSLSNGEKLTFSRELGCDIPFYAECYHGELPEGKDERSYVVGAGRYTGRLKTGHATHINRVTVGDSMRKHRLLHFSTPKLGKPYTEELIRKSAEEIETYKIDGGVGLLARYVSDDFPGIQIKMHLTVTGSGIVKRWFEVDNHTDRVLEDQQFLRDEFDADLITVALPHRGRVVETRAGTPSGMWMWNAENLTENWMFWRGDQTTLGVVWDNEDTIQSFEWTFGFEHSLGGLEPGEKLTTSPVIGIIDLFSHWSECRRYALHRQVQPEPSHDSTEIQINGGNPFVPAQFEIELIEHKKQSLHGTVSATSRSSGFSPARISVQQGESRSHATIPVAYTARPEIDVIDLSADLGVLSYERRRVVFPAHDGEVRTRTAHEHGHNVLEVENGALTLRAAVDFAPVLFSCSFHGEEWLDTAFPHLPPRDWWNPWMGGLGFRFQRIGNHRLLREPREGSFVTLTDNHGNEWTGIHQIITFTEHEELKGLRYSQTFAVLPGAPVLVAQAAIDQNTGTHLSGKTFGSAMFSRAGETARDTSLRFLDRRMEPVVLRSGREEHWITPPAPSCFEVRGADRSNRMFAYCSRPGVDMEGVTNKGSTLVRTSEKVTCRNNERVTLNPLFLVFGDSPMGTEMLKDLAGIRLQLP